MVKSEQKALAQRPYPARSISSGPGGGRGNNLPTVTAPAAQKQFLPQWRWRFKGTVVGKDCDGDLINPLICFPKGQR